MCLPRALAIFLPLLTACKLGAGRDLLAQGRASDVLKTVRAKDAPALRLRARALHALGRRVAARHELRIAQALDPGSIEGALLLGRIAAELGEPRQALARFEEVLVVKKAHPEACREAGLLLLRRGLLRIELANNDAAAQADLERAAALLPGLRGVVGRLADTVRKRHRAASCHADLLRRTKVADPARCHDPAAGRALARLRKSAPVLGCAGVSLALWLEGRGCLRRELEVWRDLRRESPADPRWVREVARTLLGLRQPKQARIVLVDYVFLADDRAAAQLDSARLLLEAKQRGWAASAAVQALGLTRALEQALEALRLLRAAGTRRQALEGARMILQRSWPGLAAEEVRRRVETIIGRSLSPPRKPPR